MLAGVTNLTEARITAIGDAALLAEDTRSMLAGRIVEAAASNFWTASTSTSEYQCAPGCPSIRPRGRRIRFSCPTTLSVTIPHDWAQAFNLGRMAGYVDLMILEGLEKALKILRVHQQVGGCGRTSSRPWNTSVAPSLRRPSEYAGLGRRGRGRLHRQTPPRAPPADRRYRPRYRQRRGWFNCDSPRAA